MELRVRKYRPEDASKVDEIYNRCHGHFALPVIKNCTDIAVVEDEQGNIVALGAFELIPELTLVLDTDKSRKTQVTALKQLLNAGDVIADVRGFNEVYAFPDSNRYADILKKHFGFRDTNPILVKKVGE